MREMNVYRETMRREAARSAGHSPFTPTRLRGQLTALGSEAEFASLPQDVTNLAEPVQDSDGSFWFAAGYSAVGGDDPVGP
jgi:hypothetical protein